MLTQKQQIFEQIKKANDILITFGKNWDGDSVASALALFLFLKKLNKKIEIVAEKFNHNEPLSFLPSYKEIKNAIENLHKFIISLDVANAKISQVKYKLEDNKLNFIISLKEGKLSGDEIKTKLNNFKYDLIIVVDTPDLESIGQPYENNTDLFYKVPVINIDRHSANEEFGQINYVELTNVATSEIIFNLLKENSPALIDEDIATCLLAGMISETRSFKTPNVTPQSLSSAAELISLDARRDEIVNNLYRSRQMHTLQLWGRVLVRLSSAYNEQFVWSTISHIDFVATGSNENDLDEIVEELILNMPTVKVIALFYEKIEGSEIKTECLLHAIKNIDALELTKEFSPAGSKNSAHISLKKPIQEAEKEITATIKERLKKLTIQ